MSDDMNREFRGDGERIFDSSQGYVIVDPDGSVWECDMSGYRITALPEDAVELLPVARLTAVADAAQAVYHQYHTGEGLRPEDPEWAALGAALKALNGER